jgi:CRISPR-associated endoribonuclease Cas2
MRIIVFFDLPTYTAEDRGNYNKFRKFLLKDGFFMMQESVYCKLAVNQEAANAIIMQVKANKPNQGLIQALTVTEKQFSSIELILGENYSDVVNTTERIIVI